ncbi:tRNA pseudouridine synthase B [Arsenophonus endosymbiont of Aleurodicus dispersus]|uniref:tRNA pseudouridine(55) synthase TruB n=1 Tax=Arsenophonus endosymbiont of Aleurodicus dispersus TaxID=235559 RepID=UPI000EAC01B4|nr:tRNA pseudouridine(55) synthase TruB [Arsenophonus endosymbiont of Aleurodicus dispersus]VAY02183.1 tRNA pseudouridine synthase B [Arsenophonus endosymbiont of Aleurodicus dispersus]
MRRRIGREVHGVLLLDKPAEYSSNDALQKVRYLFNAKKAGHTGALDPLATGMLPICLGEATKFSQFLFDSDKHYRVIARLGQRTDTSDAHGKIICQRPIEITQYQFDKALDKFRGNLIQVPSMYSALKYRGKPLYEYARRGVTIEREGRPITVYGLQFERWEDNELELTIHCSKGTYIRTIIDDLGEILGCGAHVIYLRRLQVASYPIERMVTIEQLYTLKQKFELRITSLEAQLDSLLLPMDKVVSHFPEVNISSNVATYFKKGQAVVVINHRFSKGNKVRVTEGDRHKFIGIAEIDEQNKIAPRRLVV